MNVLSTWDKLDLYALPNITEEEFAQKTLPERYDLLELALLTQNKRMLQLCESLTKMCITAENLGALLNALIDGFEAGDADAVAVQLRKMSESRKAGQHQVVH